MTAPRPSRSEWVHLEAQLAGCYERMSELVAFALALESDDELRSAVQGAVPVESRSACRLSLGEGGPYLPLVHGRVVAQAASIAGEPAAAPMPTFDVSQELGRNRRLAGFVRTRLDTSGARAEAARSLRLLEQAAHRLRAADFAALRRWSAILALEACRYSVCTQELVDRTRGLTRADPSDSALRRHWQRIHALSHWTLVATSAEPTDWLVRMSQSFEWERWTPSFPLVRERLLRLAVRGAWVAGRYGPAVVDPYLRFVVEAPHLLRVFDAVLGTTAIASACAPEHGAIRSALGRALRRRAGQVRDENSRLVLEACVRSVDLALDNPEGAMERTLERGRRLASSIGIRDQAEDPRIATFLTLDDEVDGAEIDEDGYFPSILATVAMARRSTAVFFAPTADDERVLRDWDLGAAATLLARSGRQRLCACGSGKPARECCAN